MTMSPPDLTPEGVPEAAAVTLLRHLEWQSDSFSIVFLFADVGPALALAEWVQRRLSPQLPMLRQEVPDRFVQAPEAWLQEWLERIGDQGARSSAVWLAMQRHAADRHWNQARRLFLARLNERRFLLERDLRRPLVLVLPVSFKAEARKAAPDLWHVRAFSQDLTSARSAGGSGHAVHTDTPQIRRESLVSEVSMRASGAADEWARSLATGAADTAYLPLAWSAVADLLSLGRVAEASAIAHQSKELARERLQASLKLAQDPAAAQRLLSIALDNVGKVAQAQGDWTGAESAYRESLGIRRELVERLGGTPEALRDVSISLDNVGKVAQAQGDWPGAESAYRESLGISRELVERLGGTPEALDDLAISLVRLATVREPADAAGLSEAATIYASLARQCPQVAAYADRLALIQDLLDTRKNALPDPCPDDSK